MWRISGISISLSFSLAYYYLFAIVRAALSPYHTLSIRDSSIYLSLFYRPQMLLRLRLLLLLLLY